MCGIAGFLDPAGWASYDPERLARHMGDAIRHRGPDAGDIWLDPDVGLAFSHRRLSIVDLSAAGNQPMTSSCGRYVICYNGEIYNADDLRPGLKEAGIQFRGQSDTEVILESCAIFGLEQTVGQLIGMFAIALWDRKERRLWLVRDRLGIKPIYWHLSDKGSLLFGSELKSLLEHPACPRSLNRDAISAFLRFNYVPAPHSIYEGVSKLEPGQILTLQAGDHSAEITSFWSMEQTAKSGMAHPYDGSEEEAIDHLETLLGDAVSRRMIADVPLGAFLSGGIDSSTVVALMQKHSEKPVRTFSIGFDDSGYNEAQHAKEVARHLGTEHTELYVSPDQAMSVVEDLPRYYDEPFSDSSQVPTYLVSEMTRKHVTVALSGDGGDELFAGYNRHIQGRRLSGRIDRMPAVARSLSRCAIHALSPAAWDRLFQLVPASKRPAQPGDKLYKLASILDQGGDGFYRRLVSHWTDPDQLVIDGQEPKGPIWDDQLKDWMPDPVQRMQFLDALTYLPDDILTKVDRASMAVALEARVPILDHRVVEFAWSLPDHMKLRDGQGKWLLRQLLYRHVPREMVERPKMGFAVPIADWLRGPLRDWAENLLSRETFEKYGLLRYEPVERVWQAHKSGSRNHQYELWDILMLHQWAEHYRP